MYYNPGEIIQLSGSKRNQIGVELQNERFNGNFIKTVGLQALHRTTILISFTSVSAPPVTTIASMNEMKGRRCFLRPSQN
jgi:hypothetical protein